MSKRTHQRTNNLTTTSHIQTPMTQHGLKQNDFPSVTPESTLLAYTDGTPCSIFSMTGRAGSDQRQGNNNIPDITTRQAGPGGGR